MSAATSTPVWPRRRRSRRARIALLIGLVGLLLAGTAYVLFGLKLFLAGEVNVTGTKRLSASTVSTVAAVPRDVPLARLDTDAIARRISALPAVAAVDVRRHWPHAVRIKVTERVPLLAVRRDEGYALVDAEGVAFATVRSAPPRLPQVALAGAAGATPSKDPTVSAVLGVVKALSPPLRAAMLRLEASSDSGISLLLRDGRRVVWGANERSAEKAEVLAALLQRKGKVYDVSAPTVVTVAG